MAVSGVILALYFWAYFAPRAGSVTDSLLVSDLAAITAGVTIVVGLASYFWTPQKYALWGSLSAFLTLSALAAVLIVSTGGTASPFIALWMIVAVFAGVFGWYGLVPLLAASLVYAGLQAVAGTLSRDAVVAIVLAGELPLAISYMVWHTRPSGDSGSDRAYLRLANELGQVSNKSGVVINAITDGVVALDGKGIIELINPAAQQIIGWGDEDAVTLDYKSVLKLIDNEGQAVSPATDPILQSLTNNQQLTSTTMRLLTSSKAKLQISINVAPVGQLGSGVIIVFRDITKEKAEEREQTEFISTASHEMRTPVATIEGYIGLALNPATAQIDDKARTYITKAHDSAQHLGRLFANLLDVAKADDGRLTSNPKAVDVTEFVQGLVEGLRPQAEAKGLRVLFRPQPDDDKPQGGRRLDPVYYADVDNDHLREVIGNLVENAIKYTIHGDVTIDVTGDEAHVTVSVADSGVGIPKENQAHLFQKFYRVDNTETREIGGTGLGLYLSRRLAEAMAGRIWVESEYKKGSTFYLEIPRINHEDAMRSIENSTEAQQIIPTTQARIEPLDTQTNVATVLTTLPVANQPPAQSAVMPAPVYTQQSAPAQPQATQQQQQQQQQQPSHQQQQQQPTWAPSAAPVDQPQFVNTPLSQIEQNPERYTSRNSGTITPPPRQ